MLRMTANLCTAIAVLSFAGTGLFTLGYLSWGDNVAAVITLFTGLFSAFMWLAIGGLIDLLIDNAQTNYANAQANYDAASALTKLANKKPKRRIVKDVSNINGDPKMIKGIIDQIYSIEAQK